MSTGWFGIPGSQRSEDHTKVHYVDRQLRPLCGAKLRRQMKYQWCAEGNNPTYVECEQCRKLGASRAPVRVSR